MWNPKDCSFAFAGPLALAASIAASGALAQEPTQETQVAAQTNAPTVLICKTLAITGSRIKHEYCLTEEDWDEIRENSVRTLERLMRIGTET